LFDNDFPGFTPKEKRFEGLLDLINAHPMGDNLG
jgi:hypothetical protein